MNQTRYRNEMRKISTDTAEKQRLARAFLAQHKAGARTDRWEVPTAYRAVLAGAACAALLLGVPAVLRAAQEGVQISAPPVESASEAVQNTTTLSTAETRTAPTAPLQTAPIDRETTAAVTTTAQTTAATEGTTTNVTTTESTTEVTTTEAVTTPAKEEIAIPERGFILVKMEQTQFQKTVATMPKDWDAYGKAMGDLLIAYGGDSLDESPAAVIRLSAALYLRGDISEDTFRTVCANAVDGKPMPDDLREIVSSPEFIAYYQEELPEGDEALYSSWLDLCRAVFRQYGLSYEVQNADGSTETWLGDEWTLLTYRLGSDGEEPRPMLPDAAVKAYFEAK